MGWGSRGSCKFPLVVTTQGVFNEASGVHIIQSPFLGFFRKSTAGLACSVLFRNVPLLLLHVLSPSACFIVE